MAVRDWRDEAYEPCVGDSGAPRYEYRMIFRRRPDDDRPSDFVIYRDSRKLAFRVLNSVLDEGHTLKSITRRQVGTFEHVEPGSFGTVWAARRLEGGMRKPDQSNVKERNTNG